MRPVSGECVVGRAFSKAWRARDSGGELWPDDTCGTGVFPAVHMSNKRGEPREGNTRTTAVFFIKYLRTLGFDVTNDIFAEHAWYFRNALVRANYNDLKNGIYETTEFLEIFLRNLLLNENHPLHNRTLHVSETFKETEKPDIEALKPDIEKLFQPKTASHILKLREAFPGQMIFGRSDVMKVIDIKASRASDLLREMVEYGVIEPVSGHRKGKYQFRQY